MNRGGAWWPGWGAKTTGVGLSNPRRWPGGGSARVPRTRVRQAPTGGNRRQDGPASTGLPFQGGNLRQRSRRVTVATDRNSPAVPVAGSGAHSRTHVVEAVRQLRGDAEGRQIAKARHALITGNGATMSEAVALVLGAEQ